MKPRTPEHQARVEKMRARLAEMPDHDVLSVLDMIMGFGGDEAAGGGVEDGSMEVAVHLGRRGCRASVW